MVKAVGKMRTAFSTSLVITAPLTTKSGIEMRGISLDAMRQWWGRRSYIGSKGKTPWLVLSHDSEAIYIFGGNMSC